MKSFARGHLSDQDLHASFVAGYAREQNAFAENLADLAEVDARRMYLPMAYPSIHSYCVHAAGMSEDRASKRIQAARLACRFPVIFLDLHERRLHLTGVCLLAPHLTEANAEDLLGAARGKTKAEIQQLIAERFPRSEMLTMVADGRTEYAPAHTRGSEEEKDAGQHAPGHTTAVPASAEHAPAHVASRATPLAKGSFGIQFSVGQEFHDDLAYAQALLRHQVPSGDLPQVLGRALKALIRELEKTRFGATSRPRKGGMTSYTRCVPVAVKREVWERDGGRCTFVSGSGQRCPACELLEFDHIEPAARGGPSTTANLRLRCRAHNQYEAERIFGRDFMEQRRIEARAHRRAGAVGEHAPAHVGLAHRRARAAGEHAPAHVGRPASGATASLGAHVEEVIPWLRSLGFRADEARNAAELCASMTDASLEERVKMALRSRRGRGSFAA